MEYLSKVLLVTVFALFHLVASCVCGDETITEGNVQCKILGQSGKIRLVYIGNNTEGNFSDSNDNQLTFEVDSIYERDAQGNEVGKTGPKKHSLNSLASQEFNFTKVDNVSYYQGIKVININLTAYLDGPQAALDVMVFLFLEDGNVTFGNESFAVFRGTLKFNIKIKDWEFCDPGLSNCRKGQTNEEGAFIDITLAVKSKGTPTKLSKEDRGKAKKKPVCYKDMDCPETYDMGGGSEVLINKEILLDDDPVDMPDPFPKYETQGSKKLFIFRIPRFNNTVLIDPTANMDGVAGEPIIGGGGDGNGGDGNGGDGNGGGGNGGGDSGDSTTGPPNGSAPMLLLNVFALVFPLLAAITLTVF